MRLAYVFDNRVPSPQADTEQLVNMAAALSRRGIEVRLVLPRIPPEADAEEVRAYYGVEGCFSVERYPAPVRPRVAQKVWAGLRLALGASLAPDEVVYTRNLPVALSTLVTGRPVVLDTYRPWPDQVPLLRPLLRRLAAAPGFGGAILHSALARRAWLRHGIPEGKLTVAHNGFRPGKMEPRLGRDEARRLVGFPEDRPVVVYTGRVDGEKGLDVVLAMARRCPDVLFALVGARNGGAFVTRAREHPNVEVVPWRPADEVSRYLYAADVLVSPPSRAPLERHGSTVLPMKIFSYLAAGRPILAPDTEDMRELLVDGENASLVPPDDVEACLDRLHRVLTDPDLGRRLSEGALRTARTLTWDDRAERVHAFLEERLGG